MRARASTSPPMRRMWTSRAAPPLRRRRSASGASVPTPITPSSADSRTMRPPTFPAAADSVALAPAEARASIYAVRCASRCAKAATPGASLAAAHVPTSSDPHAHRHLGFDEGAHRGQPALRTCALPGGRAHECFTLGTRLTRVTGAFRLRNPDRALERAAALAPDWDGGTRIGDALRAFLSVPRFAGLARGAAVIVLSDGLERGAPDAMVEAVQRLSRLAWRLSWLTPLAADAGFRPETAALTAVLPWLDDLGDGATPARLRAHVLGLGRVRGRGSDARHRARRNTPSGTAREHATGSGAR